MKLRQLPPLLAVLPAVTPWGSVLAAVAAGALLVGTAGPDPGSVVFKLRLSGLAVAATAAGLLADTAAVTLASSPMPLAVRRLVRIAVVAAVALSWWLVGAALAGSAVGPGQAPALLRELVVLTALAVLGSTAVQRWSGDARGGTGALLAIVWFALSLLPKMANLPLPPPPAEPASAGPLTVVVVVALGLVLLLSRDPAGLRLSGRLRRER